MEEMLLYWDQDVSTRADCFFLMTDIMVGLQFNRKNSLHTQKESLYALSDKKNVFVLRERATVDVDPLWHLTDWLIPSAVQRQESRKQGHEHGNKATKTQEQKKKEKISSENVRESN